MIANYRHIGNIKGGIFLVGVFLIIGIFYYTNFLSKELREDNRQVVKLYAEIIAGATLSLEISLICAIGSHTWTDAHMKYGRK